MRPQPRCQRNSALVGIPSILVNITIILIIFLGFKVKPIVSLDTRDLKLAAGSPISAYDQYDFYFAQVCKSNYNTTDSQDLVTEKICLDYEGGMMILKDFGQDLPESILKHLEWLDSYLDRSLYTNITALFVLYILICIFGTTVFWVGLETLRSSKPSNKVEFESDVKFYMYMASFQATIHIITNAVFVSALVGLGGRFRCTDEVCIPMHRSWLMLGFSTLASFEIFFAMSAMAYLLCPDCSERRCHTFCWK
ncbi:uncharacterized protein Bfra_008512 [Botrytis fragariae]|uniref:Uncharacterized protein n=1 Tax=Botrytis fragariae TaxID=1964551 RepID=A0A8H6ATB4_9HELO|nr:uncharacterized protein Bfra_008512 [Botrytis fragariae]KAF5873232.1 hypothetical protein Bfra_008512 [Botrytis fragariae]